MITAGHAQYIQQFQSTDIKEKLVLWDFQLKPTYRGKLSSQTGFVKLLGEVGVPKQAKLREAGFGKVCEAVIQHRFLEFIKSNQPSCSIYLRSEKVCWMTNFNKTAAPKKQLLVK